MKRLAKHQAENNAAADADCWERFGVHRARTTALVCPAPGPGPSRLCVLGAGNCNDLDLAALLRRHGEAHLVDLDAAALARGVERQGLAGHPAVRLHGGTDLTGALDALAGWSPASPVSEEELAACRVGPLRRARPALPGPFDVAASTCLLTQMIQCVVRALGEGHPRFVEVLRAVRAGHLRLLADLVAPGGTGVLVTDVVSSDTFPSLASVGEGQLPALLGRLVREGNFFHGANPAALASDFLADPAIAPHGRGRGLGAAVAVGLRAARLPRLRAGLP
jgi:hypothetical protein